MSRRSKRRRTQPERTAAPDGFEFLDDRAERGTVAPLPATKLASTSLSVAGAPAPKKRGTWVTRARHSEALDAEATAPAPLPRPAGDDRAPDVTEVAADASIENAPVATVVSVATEPLLADGDGATAPDDAGATPSRAPVVAGPPQPTLGELLAGAREARHLSIEAASARTRIGVKMLRNLEGDRFDEFAAVAYARGSLRAYAGFLGLDVAAVMQRFDVQVAPAVSASDLVEEAPAAQVPAAAAPPEAPRRKPRTGAVQWGRLATVAAGVAAVALGFGVYRAASHDPVDLRPRAGLAQIEDELRRAQGTAPPVVVAPAPQTAAAQTEAEDTAPTVPQAAVPQPEAIPAPARSRADTPAPVTDMELVTPPLPVSDADAKAATASIPTAALILQATATGPCAIRIQVDADAAGAVVYEFAAGESLSWMAERSFRITPRRGARRNLQLLLNGKPIATPADGRSVRLDGASHRPAPPAPARAAQTTRTRSRAAATRNTQPPRPQSARPVEPHGGQPPPR